MFTEPVSVSFQKAFSTLAGASPQFHVALRDDAFPFAQSVVRYTAGDDVIFVTSKQRSMEPEDPHENTVTFTQCQRSKSGKWSRIAVQPENAPVNATGGFAYPGGMLVCQSGNATGDPAAIIFMSEEPPHSTTNLLDSFNGRDFNSPSQLVVHSDGSIWFTDPAYGFEQGIRPEPQLRCQVYRFDPDNGDVRAMADDLDMPNGICFSPDEKTLFVTDTGRARGDGSTDDGRPATM